MAPIVIKTTVKNPDKIKIRRRQICYGAMKVFREKGFHAASIREIAQASRLSIGALYNYIERKEDILYLVHEELLGHLDECLDQALQRHQDAAQGLMQAIQDVFEQSIRLKGETLFMYTESRFLDKKDLHRVLDKESRYVDKLEAIIRKGMVAGVFECREPAIFANMVALLMALIPLRGWNLLPSFSEKEVLKELVALILRGLNAVVREPDHVSG